MSNEEKVRILMDFVDSIISAVDSGFVEGQNAELLLENTLSLRQLLRIAQIHGQDNYGVTLDTPWAKDLQAVIDKEQRAKEGNCGC